MDERERLRRGVLAEVKPIIERIFSVIEGAPAGPAAYALLSSAVTAWRKTGLSDSKLHETLDGLLDRADAVEAMIKAGRN